MKAVVSKNWLEEEEEEEGLHGVFKRLHRNGHQLEKGLQMAQRGPSLKNWLEEEEGLQGVFKRLRRNRHLLEKGLQMAQRRPSLK
jgi:hypothetical protein